jgi:hypothetical protein
MAERVLNAGGTSAATGVAPRSCASCGSITRREFDAEIAVHLPFLMGMRRPPIFVFPKLLVCLDCGGAEFWVRQTELRELAKA